MAELDTSGGGHKKGPGVKKGKKAINACGFNTDGGFRFPFDYLLHLHYHDESTNRFEVAFAG